MLSKSVLTKVMALPLLLLGACTVNQDERYYNAAQCNITTDLGVTSPDGAHQSGGAFTASVNNSLIFLRCDVPYTRRTDNLASIDVRARVLDGHNDDSVSIQLCERMNDLEVVCHDDDATGSSFTGLDTLNVSFTPTSDTRWPFIRVRVVGNLGVEASGMLGYRVCRGGCD